MEFFQRYLIIYNHSKPQQLTHLKRLTLNRRVKKCFLVNYSAAGFCHSSTVGGLTPLCHHRAVEAHTRGHFEHQTAFSTRAPQIRTLRYLFSREHFEGIPNCHWVDALQLPQVLFNQSLSARTCTRSMRYSSNWDGCSLNTASFESSMDSLVSPL